MGSYRVYVTRRIPQNGIDLMLSESLDVEVRSSEEVPSKAELLEAVKGIDALLCLLTDPVDGEVISAGESLKVIANYAVGYDNIDVSAATDRGIMVTNTPGVLTETTADMAWALLMSIARRICEANAFTRAGSFKRWEPTLLLGGDVQGKILGIVGLGRIGKAVARRASGFDMRVLYHSVPREPPEIEKELGASYVELDELLRESDFVTLHTPLTPATQHLIGETQLDMMKPSAYLVNTSRGPVVDEKALAEALRRGKIAGAALDVYEWEPSVTEDLVKLENVVLTPHIASGSIETRERMAKMAAQNIIAGLRGERPPNLVNPRALT
jgi:glyoxylate reductase